MSTTVNETSYTVTLLGNTVTVKTAGTQGIAGTAVVNGSNDGDVLVWNATSGAWEAQTLRSQGIIVTIPTSGEYKIYELRLDSDKKIVITYEDTAES